MTVVHEPGTVRQIHYSRGRGVDGKFPVTMWGSVEDQIAEASLENGLAVSRLEHDMIPLYRWSEDCEHSSPEDDERYRDVDELVDEWMRRNAPCLTYRDGDLYWKNLRRGAVSVPLYAEWRAAQDAYDEHHVGQVCLLTPAGECCRICTEGDDDFGFEAGDCQLERRVRDEYDAFWWRVSPEGIADRAPNQTDGSER